MIKVNLLPEENKAEIEQAKKNLRLLRIFNKLLLLTFGTVLIIGGLGFYLQTKANSSSKTLSEKEKSIDKYGNLEDEAKTVSDKLQTIKQISADSYKWSGVLAEINKVVSSGVYLTGIKMDSNTKVRGQITGYAISKSNVASFQEAMENSEKFEFVDIESSQTQTDPASAQVRENFTISFTFAKGALK